MKKCLKFLFMSLVLLLLVVGSGYVAISHAASAVWDAPTDGSEVAGYVLYYTDGTTKYSKDVGNVLKYDLGPLNLVPGVQYTFTVTAYNAAGESPESNAVDWTRQPFVVNDNPAPVTINIPGPVTNITINVGP